MNPRIAGLLSILIMSCSEEVPVRMLKPLPQKTLQFQSSSMTLIEGEGLGTATPTAVVIQTTEATQESTPYYVIMKYKADLAGGSYSSRFSFDGSHKKFDGTMSIPVVVKNVLDESGTMRTTVIQLEFEKNSTSSFFTIGAINNDKTEANEIVELEVSATNPLSGVCPSHLSIGQHNMLKVTLEDFH